MTDDEAQAAVSKALKDLREFFPHVQILVTWERDTDGNTRDLFSGSGNWYARVGMAHEFLNRDQGQVTAKEIGDRLDPPDPALQT